MCLNALVRYYLNGSWYVSECALYIIINIRACIYLVALYTVSK